MIHTLYQLIKRDLYFIQMYGEYSHCITSKYKATRSHNVGGKISVCAMDSSLDNVSRVYHYIDSLADY